MMEKPILFNTEMVKAILEGRKTQTRRIMKPQQIGCFQGMDGSTAKFSGINVDTYYIKSPYQVGDILYIRETWGYYWEEITCMITGEVQFLPREYVYKADNNNRSVMRWHPSIHMPKEAARIWLKVTNVRVERLQDITEADAIREGVKAYGPNNCSGTSARIAFAELWDSVYDNWLENPWVWVIEFERVGGRQ